jgi:hypothetical protein
VRSTFVNRDALDQRLLQRFGGKVRWGLAAECSRHRELSNRLEFCAALVLTGYTGKDESSAETGDNGAVQTLNCSRTKGVQRVWT